MRASKNRALATNEARLVERSLNPASLSGQELSNLVAQLRARRNRAQRMIRKRTRDAAKDGRENLDAGAREKKQTLVQALGRAADEIARRRNSSEAFAATDNLREAVQRRSKSPAWTGPDDRTADLGPAEMPNRRIAPPVPCMPRV